MPKGRACVARERRTPFVDIFRTTPTSTVCPNFYVLSHGNGCTFSPLCQYCYLKSSFWYLGGPQVFTNTQKLVSEVRAWLQKDHLESYVLNTGNLSDSLAFEARRPLIVELVELFRAAAEVKGRPHCLLLVTKGGTRECRPLWETAPCRSVIVSFSVNAPEAASRFEAGAAVVSDRMAAAGRLLAAGWRVRIRIDPMIQGYDYQELAQQVRALAPERVTLGSLRAEPSLPRFVGVGVFAGLEKPAEAKGLMRYPYGERLELYRQASEILVPECQVALCEETPEMWAALGLEDQARRCNCAL